MKKVALAFVVLSTISVINAVRAQDAHCTYLASEILRLNRNVSALSQLVLDPTNVTVINAEFGPNEGVVELRNRMMKRPYVKGTYWDSERRQLLLVVDRRFYNDLAAKKRATPALRSAHEAIVSTIRREVQHGGLENERGALLKAKQEYAALCEQQNPLRQDRPHDNGLLGEDPGGSIKRTPGPWSSW